MPNRRSPSIRHDLEIRSRTRNPELHLRPRPAARAGLRLRWQDRVLLTLAAVLGLLLLLRVGTARAEDPPWGLTFLDGQDSAPTLALDTAMHAEVTGLLARVLVAQSFHNDGNDWVEGVYRFPLPDGAAVDRLFIQVGERVLEGEIREREAAQRVYQQARDRGQAAGLVAQERANQFSTHLANIGPGETIRVMIGYLVNVDYRDGAYHLRLPTTFTPRWGREAQPATGQAAAHPHLASLDSEVSHGFSLQVDLQPGAPLASLESLHHDVDIQVLEQGYQVTLLHPDERTDRSFELRWAPEFASAPSASLSTWSDGQDVFAQLMIVPPREEALDPLTREVVFVIDTSGSMQGASLDQASAALVAGLEALDAADRFNLMQFNSVTEALFRSPEPVTDRSLAEARRWIENLEANGGTNMAPALRSALHAPAGLGTDGVRQVVFITDGSVGNEGELLRDIADRLGASRLFTVAIGAAPNGGFLRKAAEFGRGHYTHIGRVEDVGDAMTALWTRIRLPAVSDLCIDWGQPAESYPEIIPDLYTGEPLWVVARMAGPPGAVTLCGELNGRPWRHVDWPAPVEGPETLATLWAQRKVEALGDSLLFGADPEAMRAEITEVALAHGLLTPWTSLVAVDRTPARPAGEALTGANVPNLLPAGSTTGRPFPPTATGWKGQLLLSLLVLSVSGGLFLRPFGGATAAPGAGVRLRRVWRRLPHALAPRFSHRPVPRRRGPLAPRP